MSRGTVTVNRTLVGLIALACLATAVGMWLFAPVSEDNNWSMWQAAFTRVGLLMSAFWLALPSGDREAAWSDVTPWTLLGLLLAVIGIAARPRIAIPALLALAVLAFVLRPRPKKRPEDRR